MYKCHIHYCDSDTEIYFKDALCRVCSVVYDDTRDKNLLYACTHNRQTCPVMVHREDTFETTEHKMFSPFEKTTKHTCNY